jgi:hypothetical protein
VTEAISVPWLRIDRAMTRQAALYIERYADLPAAPSAESVRRAFDEPGVLPDYIPPVTTLQPGKDGWIWLQREQTGADSTAWNALDPSGTMRGTVLLPADARIMAARGDHLAVLELDQFDLPYVLVIRISRESAR